MKRIAIAFLIVATYTAPAVESIPVTFTNLAGDVFSNVVVVKVERDGILFRRPEGNGYGRVKFTNMSQLLQLKFGYDQEALRKADEEPRSKAAVAEELRIARAKAAQYDSIKNHGFYIDPIKDSEFPKTEKAKATCKEVASELKGMHKALELGLSYSKFSDLLTEKALAVEKAKDLKGEGVGLSFWRRVDECINAFKKSREWWKEEIDAEYKPSKDFSEYCMREYWEIADLHLIYCIGIADQDKEANSRAIDQLAAIIKAEQDAVKAGVLNVKENGDPVLYNMSVEGIANRIKATLPATNSIGFELKP